MGGTCSDHQARQVQTRLHGGGKQPDSVLSDLHVVILVGEVGSALPCNGLS